MNTDNMTWTISDYTPTVTTNCVNWSYQFYPYAQTVDRTEKAYEIAKMLMSRKMVECRTVTQFTSLMDELLKVL